MNRWGGEMSSQETWGGTCLSEREYWEESIAAILWLNQRRMILSNVDDVLKTSCKQVFLKQGSPSRYLFEIKVLKEVIDEPTFISMYGMRVLCTCSLFLIGQIFSMALGHNSNFRASCQRGALKCWLIIYNRHRKNAGDPIEIGLVCTCWKYKPHSR